MKKFILATVAATLLATPVLAAPQDRHDDRGRTEQNHRVVTRTSKTVIVRHDDRRPQARQQAQARKWARGQRFDSRYANNYRVLQNPRQYRLHDAPRGYRWVQSGHDAVLVGIASGIIASVMANMIR